MKDRRARAIQEAAKQVIFAGCLTAIEKLLSKNGVQQFLESKAGQKYKTPLTLNATQEDSELIAKIAESYFIPCEWVRVICEVREFVRKPVKDEIDMLDIFYYEAKLGDAEDLLESLVNLR